MRFRNGLIAAATMVVWLTGCETLMPQGVSPQPAAPQSTTPPSAPRQTAQRAPDDLDRVAVQTIQCYEDVQSVPQLAGLYKKFPLIDPPNFDQLFDKSKPNGSEKAAIAEFYDMVQPCRSRLLRDLMQSEPYWVPIYAKIITRHDEIYVALVSGEMTWGEANREVKLIEDWRLDEDKRIADMVKTEFTGAYRAEIEQGRAGAAGAYAFWESNRPRFCAAIGAKSTCS